MLVDESKLYDEMTELYKGNCAKLEVFKMKMELMSESKGHGSMDEKLKLLSECGALEGYNAALTDMIKAIMKVREEE